MERINKLREEQQEGGRDFNWEDPETRAEINAFIEFISEESEDGRRKMVDQWDHYCIARDSSFKWDTVAQYKRPKTFEHGADKVLPAHKDQELSIEEKVEKFKKAERDAKYKRSNAPSGGKAKGGRKYSSSQSSSYSKVEIFYIFIIYFLVSICMLI